MEIDPPGPPAQSQARLTTPTIGAMSEPEPMPADEPAAGVPVDDELNETDAPYTAPIEKFHRSAVGEVTGAAMTGFAKALGWAVEPEEAPVIREAGAPPRDLDDPIEVTIDPDDPENSRIVFHVRDDQARS